MNDIEFKQMKGVRVSLNDGFTYTYGLTAGLYKTKKRNKNVVSRSKRADKRGVKAKALKRETNEQCLFF